MERVVTGIDRHVDKCKICALAGKESVKTKNNVLKSIGYNELWDVDMIGPIKGSTGKEKYIFATINHFISRYKNA
jgi:hypothetical protein